MFLKSFQFKLFGSFLVFGFILSSITFYIFTKVIEDGYMSHKTDLFYEMIIKNKEQILNHQKKMQDKIKEISKNSLIEKMQKDTLLNKNEIFRLLLSMDKCFLKIAYLDDDAKEIMNVSKGDIKIKAQNEDEMKKTILSLNPLQTYSSVFLYDEINQIPYYKIIRKLDKGFLAVYIDLRDSVFDKIKSTYKENWYLVDMDGRFLVHKDKKYNWENVKNKYSHSLKDEFPDNYTGILNEDVYFDNQLMSERITLLNNEEIIIILSHTENFTQDLKKEYFELFRLTIIVTILVSIFLAFVLSKPFIRMNKKLNNLNSDLDKQVRKRTKELSSSLELIDKYIISSKTDKRGIITDVSEAFCRVSGYEKEELIGKPHNIVRDTKSEKSLFENLWKSISSGNSWSGEIVNRSKDGNKYYIYSNIDPLYKDGEVIGHMAIAENITDKKKLEKLNEELEQRVEIEVEKNIAQHNKHIEDRVKSAQLSSIGQLAAGITHEINTPLTYIKGNIEMMKYDVEDISDDNLRENLTSDFVKVDDGIKRIENIIDTMREVSQSNQEDVFETNIYETLILALNMINNRSKQVSKIYINEQLFEIGLEKDQYIFNCKIQKQRVEQLWIVILNNALDALEGVEDYDERNIFVDIKSEGKKIIVTIKDNGGGIPEEIIENIFDPVFTTKKHAGLGVGLNVAKKIVDDQKGEIKAYNKDGGAVFEVSFDT